MRSILHYYTLYILLILLSLRGIELQSQDSRNGYWFPPRDTLRILLVYAELQGDPDDPVWIRGWEAGRLPPEPGYLFDHTLSPGEDPKGFLTKYYYQASFGQYVVLADYYPEMVSIDYNSVKSRGFTQVLDSIILIDSEDILTANGYSVNSGDFDYISTSSMGRPKKTEPDSLIDLVMVMWRVNSKLSRNNSAGFCSTSKYMKPVKAMKGMNSYSSFVNKDYTYHGIIGHEFSHLLLGGNNFHTGGPGAGTKTFMSDAGGYAMLSSYERSSPVYCSFDRRRLGWKHPDNQFQISARSPTSNEEINADLRYQQDFTHGSNEFILRDFVESGDAIRIELPWLNTFSDKINKQWLWLENHQKLDGNIDHDKASRKGLYAYIQVGKEILTGPGTFAGNCNYTWPVSAFGNYDICIDEETTEAIVSNDRSNSFTGYNNLIEGAYDLGEKDEVIYRNEVFGTKNIIINGEYPDSSLYNFATYPVFGTSMDAFQAGDKIGIDRNPSAVPVLTYRTLSSSRARPRPPIAEDNRMIHLNGIAVEFLEQLPDGSIKLRIRWDDTRVDGDVRWCGNIQLHEVLTLEKGAKIWLDQGYTPQRPLNPVKFNGENLFTDPTSLSVNKEAVIRLKKKSKLDLDNGSSLLLNTGGEIILDRRSRIIVRDSCKLVIHSGSKITGKGKIILARGSKTDMDQSSLGVRVKSRRR